jgi:hypothetical protein
MAKMRSVQTHRHKPRTIFAPYLLVCNEQGSAMDLGERNKLPLGLNTWLRGRRVREGNLTESCHAGGMSAPLTVCKAKNEQPNILGHVWLTAVRDSEVPQAARQCGSHNCFSAPASIASRPRPCRCNCKKNGSVICWKLVRQSINLNLPVTHVSKQNDGMQCFRRLDWEV